MHVDDDAGRGVDARQLFDRQDRFEEFAAASAILLRDLDAHQPKLKELLKEVPVKHTFFVHLLGKRADALAGELPDVVAKENLVFGQRGEGRGIGCSCNCFRHTDTFRLRMANH